MNGEARSARVCGALEPYGTSIFTEMTALANREGAVNLSQGFPDFDGPREVRRLAADAILAGPNQYAPSAGVPALREAVAEKLRRFHGLTVDPSAEVTVTAGASEGLAATFLGLVEPGDEVILLDPSYDLYAPMVARAGGRPVHVPLDREGFALPEEALGEAFGERTAAIVVNNPQNPCAKVYSRGELETIARLCERHDAVAIGDEVYEHLVYGDRSHVTLIDVDGLRDRAVVISSTAKTFSMTGWKVGYAVACPELTEAVRMSHQFITFCTPGALQEAMAAALSMGDDYYEGLLADYTRKRDLLCGALDDLGFTVIPPEGTYYVNVDISGEGFADDLDFCRRLTTEAKVAAIPDSFFYEGRRGGRDLARFCFCKRDETLEEGIRRLRAWRAQ